MTIESRRALPVRVVLGAFLVLTVGLGIRLVSRYRTSLPFNPDGFGFAARADLIANGGSTAVFKGRPHDYVLPTLLGELQMLTGANSLVLAQPAIAIIGAVPCLLVFAFVRRVALQRGWQPTHAFGLAALAGVALAMQGLYLRHSIWVHYEVLGLLFVVIVGLTGHWFFQSGHARWFLALAPTLTALPITHHLSSMMGALTLTALAVYHVTNEPDARTVLRALAVGGLFWAYFGIYYVLTRPPFFGDLAAKPGLFVAWVIILGSLAVFLRKASPTLQRLTFVVPLGVAFAVTAVNAVFDVFPGTASTHPRLLVYLGPLVVLAVLMVWGVPLAFDNHDIGPVVLALVLAPLAFVSFALTAGLSPEYNLFARRGQTFGHFTITVVGVLSVGGFAWTADRHSVLKLGIPLCLLAAILVSTPLAFAGPPVLPYEPTVTDAEFESVTFAETHIEGAWTSDDKPTRVARNYYDADAPRSAAIAWLQGGAVPACPTLVRDTWMTVGAQAYPSDPIPVDVRILQKFSTTSQIIYDGGTTDNSQRFVIPERAAETSQC
ncbi:sodium/phosphate symporter [Halovenus rubra]|uniref:Sodium/phosphate symporter n=2 Tax=Halovenus rubra TaxID=869890 RepID=A0ABD5X9X3_9EURY|nr:hypothetical protein [Halovenus rubra]